MSAPSPISFNHQNMIPFPTSSSTTRIAPPPYFVHSFNYLRNRSTFVWTEQRRRLWKDVAEACEWERPRAPSVRLLWDVRAVGAVLEFVRRGSNVQEWIGSPQRTGGRMRTERRGGQALPRMYISFAFPLLLLSFWYEIFSGGGGDFLCFSLTVVGGATMAVKADLLPWKKVI